MGKVKRRPGVSRQARVSSITANGSGRQSKLYGQTEIATSRFEDQTRLRNMLAGVSTRTQADLADMRADHGDQDMGGENFGDNNSPSNLEAGPDGAAGDEDGWEDEGEIAECTYTYDLRDWKGGKWRTYIDDRTRRQRLERWTTNWSEHLDPMTDALLRFNAGLRTSSSPSDPMFTITVIDIYSLSDKADIAYNDQISTSVALVAAGFIGTSPVHPQIAISIRTLELLRRIRLRQPSFSIQAFAKVICDLYSQSYYPKYRTQLSNAFEIYLQLIRRIDRRVDERLERTCLHWRVLNACPACTYILEDEPPQKWERMAAMDGNNSLKRVLSNRAADTRIFEESDYYLPTSYVDQFAGEVTARPSQEKRLPASQGDPADGDDEEDTECTKRWKAAGDDAKKRMWSLFDETGIFASACRHGLILWIVDMVRSGELAKYPLAILSKMLEVLGPRLLVGFDIGCSFNATIRNSSLRDAFSSSGSRVCTNAFHGYSHNYACQKKHHPNSIVGAGLEDLEGMERVFSASNMLARVVRYASPFNRRIAIDAHFKQWDEDKYANIATMLSNNFKQGQRILTEEGAALEASLLHLGLTKSDLDRFLKEEEEYLDRLQDPTNRIDLRASAYVEQLRKHKKAEDEYHSTSKVFFSALSASDFTESQGTKEYWSAAAATRKQESQRRHAQEAWEEANRDLNEMEVALGVSERWTPLTPAYQQAAKQLANLELREATDEVERLVCQRLFELQKLNISQTGYKMRTAIAHALTRRNQAIKTAVERYNNVAAGADPPRPTVEWSKISHYEFLQDFVLLRESNSDILKRPWADSVVRFTMRQYLRVQRAHEEIERCYVELRRVHTHIVDEDKFFASIDFTNEADEGLAHAVKAFIARRRRLNEFARHRIKRLYSDPRYRGNRTPGVRCDHAAEGPRAVEDGLDPPQPIDTEESDEDGGCDEDEDEHQGVLEYLAQLSV